MVIGTRYEGVSKYQAEPPDPGPGLHLWTMMVLFGVPDPAHFSGTVLHLDYSALLTVAGPGCFKCEQPYSIATAATPCTNSPDWP